jgi:putative Holliday junction resolvase
MTGKDVFLAFDYGERRIGVAIGNRVSGDARALITLTAHAGVPPWAEITHLVDEWRPAALVVGMPYARDGAEQDMSSRVHAFISELNRRLGLDVYEVDERWSSTAAESQLREARRSGALTRRVRKGDDDALAARLILQDYLESAPCT